MATPPLTHTIAVHSLIQRHSNPFMWGTRVVRVWAQDNSEVAQQNWLMAGAHHHASLPSLTPSPEGQDDTIITTIEGLVQQHDYPSVLYGGADSYTIMA